jgi:hypothetical protein
MEENDHSFLGFLSTALSQQRNERFLGFQQKSFGEGAFPFNQDEKVPAYLSVSIVEQVHN